MRSLHFMAIFTVCVTQENVDYKPVPEASTLNLRSVSTFHFSSLVEYSLCTKYCLSLRKGDLFYQQYLDDLLLKHLFFFFLSGM